MRATPAYFPQLAVLRLKALPCLPPVRGLHGCVYMLQPAGLSLLRCLIQHRVTFMLSASTKDSSVSADECAHPCCCCSPPSPFHVLYFKQHHETVMSPLCLSGLHQWTICHHFCTEVDVLVSIVWNGSIINIKQVRVSLRKVAISLCLQTNTGPCCREMVSCIVGLSLDLKCALTVVQV